MTSLITDSLGGMGSALYHSLDSRSCLCTDVSRFCPPTRVQIQQGCLYSVRG